MTWIYLPLIVDTVNTSIFVHDKKIFISSIYINGDKAFLHFRDERSPGEGLPPVLFKYCMAFSFYIILFTDQRL